MERKAIITVGTKILANCLKIHAKLGELLLTSAGTDGSTGKDNTTEKNLFESVRRFARSIELCDDYLRGFYGLKLVCFPDINSIYAKTNLQ